MVGDLQEIGAQSLGLRSMFKPQALHPESEAPPQLVFGIPCRTNPNP